MIALNEEVRKFEKVMKEEIINVNRLIILHSVNDLCAGGGLWHRTRSCGFWISLIVLSILHEFTLTKVTRNYRPRFWQESEKAVLIGRGLGGVERGRSRLRRFPGRVRRIGPRSGRGEVERAPQKKAGFSFAKPRRCFNTKPALPARNLSRFKLLKSINNRMRFFLF